MIVPCIAPKELYRSGDTIPLAAMSPKIAASSGPTDRHRLARVGDLPAHDHHQAKPEEQETQGGDAVLNADDLVVGGEDIGAPETRLFVASLVDVRCVEWPMPLVAYRYLILSSTITASSNGR